MKTIAICHQKGGVSKSTLCIGLGLELEGRVALYDSDAQGSTAKWLERREADEPISVVGPVAKLPALVSACEKQDCDWLILDTPPSYADETPIRAAMAVADFVLLPTKMGRFDLEVLPKTAKIANKLGKPWMIVLTMAQRSNVLETTKDSLTDLADRLGGSLCPTILMNRVAHVESSYHNLAVSEFEAGGLAAYEIRKIAESVKAQME